MVRYNNNWGVGIIGGRGVLGEIEMVIFLFNIYLLYIYVNNDVDSFTFEHWCFLKRQKFRLR